MEAVMSTKKPNNKEEVAFLEAAWECLRTTERELDVSIDAEIVPQKLKGVWLIYLVAVEMNPGANFNRPVARMRAEYPSAQNGTLAGCLFNALLKLDQLCYEFRHSPANAPKQ